MMKRFWWIGLAGMVALVFLGFAAYSIHRDNLEKQMGSQQYVDLFKSNLGHFQNHGTPVFIYLPVDINEISLIVPMGMAASGPPVDPITGGGAHNIPSDHSGPAFVDPTVSHKTYAVADGKLVEVDYSKARWLINDGSRLDDYGLTFQFSKNFFLKILHLTQLEPDLLTQLGTLREGYNNYFDIPIKAGQLLGYTGAMGGHLGAFDFWAIDYDAKPSYTLEKKYGGYDYSIDPYQFFVEPLKSEMYAKLPNRPEPRVGRYDYDIDGKLVGNWFHADNSGTVQKKGMPTLSFFYDCFDPSIILIGNSDTGTVDKVVGNSPDPGQIDQNSGVIKYELYDSMGKTNGAFTKAVVLVQMVGKRKIKFELFPNKTPSEVTGFDDAAQFFER